MKKKTNQPSVQTATLADQNVAEIQKLELEAVVEVKRFLKIAKSQKQIDEDTALLKSKAVEGDKGAIAVLHYLAVRSTEALNEIAEQKVSIVRPLAESKSFWPILTGPYERLKVTEKKFFEKIRLGARSPHVDAQKLFARYSEARATATMLIEWVDALRRCGQAKRRLADLKKSIHSPMESELAPGDLMQRCAELPEFSAQTVKAWYPLCRALLMDISKGTPEKIKTLRTIGAYRADHNLPGTSDEDTIARYRETNIRDGIFTQMQRAMSAIAKDS